MSVLTPECYALEGVPAELYVLGGEADEIRTMLQGLNAHQRRQLDEHLDRVMTPPIYRGRTDVDWATALADANDDKLLDFVQWNETHTLSMNESQRTQDRIARRTEKYREKIELALLSHDLPRSAEVALDRSRLVRVIIGDAFTTTVRGAAGSYSRKHGVAVLQQGASVETHEHELMHGAGKLPWLLNEIFATHSQQVASYGYPGVLDPRQREKVRAGYVERRILGETYLSAGKVEFSGWLGLEAFFEGDFQGPKVQELYAALNTSFGTYSILQDSEGWWNESYTQLSQNYPDAGSPYWGVGADVYTDLAVQFEAKEARDENFNDVIKAAIERYKKLRQEAEQTSAQRVDARNYYLVAAAGLALAYKKYTGQGPDDEPRYF
jgi:hypothetical protein